MFRQYKETGAILDFTQGLDIRLLNDEDIADINEMRLRTLHFAWDNAKENLEPKFKEFAKAFRRKSNIGMVYILTGYNSTMEENLHRIYTLRDLGYDPYVMVYDKPHAPREIRDLQRWCNNKIIFKTVPDFTMYYHTKAKKYGSAEQDGVATLEEVAKPEEKDSLRKKMEK